ncbi:MAG: hypothetical protein WC548_00050 [Candidatus Pacearchaeota archaeon]
MIKINFKKMQILNNERTVKIFGGYKKKEIIIELSILQLAKVFQCDKEILKEQENYGWGSEELEYRCKEIREIIKKFPKVKIEKREIVARYTSVTKKIQNKELEDMKDQIIIIYGEDLCGWENEGILIQFPEELYQQDLREKEFDFVLKQDSIELKSK